MKVREENCSAISYIVFMTKNQDPSHTDFHL